MNLNPTPIVRQVAVVLDIGQQAVNQQVPGSKNLNSADAGFGNLMSGLLGNVMMIGALLTFGFLIWGAIDWIGSGSDKSKAEAARTKMTQGVVGLIVLGSTTAVFRVLQGFLGICFLKIAGKC